MRSFPNTRRAMLDCIFCFARIDLIMPVIVSMITAANTISRATAISVAVSYASSGEKNLNIVSWFWLVIVFYVEQLHYLAAEYP